MLRYYIFYDIIILYNKYKYIYICIYIYIYYIYILYIYILYIFNNDSKEITSVSIEEERSNEKIGIKKELIKAIAEIFF